MSEVNRLSDPFSGEYLLGGPAAPSGRPAQDEAAGATDPRICGWCQKPLAADRPRNALYCSRKCKREAAQYRLQQRRSHAKQAWKNKAGVCHQCGRDTSAAPQYKLCETCRAIVRRSAANRRKRLSEKGICPRCGHRRLRGRYRTCPVCRRRYGRPKTAGTAGENS